MIRFNYILILLLLSMVHNEGCDIFKVRANIKVTVEDNTYPELGNITEKNSSIACVQNCSKMDQCTAVLVDTTEMTSRCCYLTNDPVTVATGNNTLYIRYDVKTFRAQPVDAYTAEGTVSTTTITR